MKSLKAPDLGFLLFRTDYSDDAAWQAALSAATAVYDANDFGRMGARLQPVESPELEHLTPQGPDAPSPRGLPR